MLSETQQRLIFDLEREHPRFMVWLVPTASGPPIWCARMKDDHTTTRTLINTGSSDDLDRCMTEVETHIPG